MKPINETAETVVRYTMVTNDGPSRPAKLMIYESTPQWVCDLINGCADMHTMRSDYQFFADQFRQLFVVDACHTIKNNSKLRVDRTHADLKMWAESFPFRETYIKEARKTLGKDATQISVWESAQRAEREEIYHYVKDFLSSPEHQTDTVVQ